MKKKFKLQKNNLGSRVKAGALAFLMLGMSIVNISCNKRQKYNVSTPTDAIEESIDSPDLSLVSPGQLGIKLELLPNTSFMEKLTGDFDINQVVRDTNGTLWASQEDLEKSKNIGKVVIDTKDGKYEVTKDSSGNTVVKEKSVGYKIVDSDGNVIDSGEEIPSGYKQIEGTEDLIGQDYTVANHDYYDSEGNVVIEKGDVIKNETESKANKELATSKSEVKEPTTRKYVEEKTSSPEEIIDELVRQGIPYEDARRAVLGEESTTIKPTEPATKKAEPKTEMSTTEKQEVTTQEPTTKEESTTQEPTTKKEEVVTQAPTTEKQESGYYEIYGLKFLSKADYDQWVIQGYTGYSERNGIMVADTYEMEEEYQKSLGGN